MKTENLYYFIKVCEAGSINKASEQLCISAQGLGKVLKKLEDEIGIVLLNRTAQGLSLTENGSILYDSICDILRAESRLIKNANSLKKDKAPHRCLLGNTDAFRGMSDVLKANTLNDGEIIIPEIFTGDPEDLEHAFLSGDYEYCVGIKECVKDSSALPYEVIFRIKYLYAVNKDSKLAELSVIAPADLEGHTLLYEDQDSLIIRRLIRQAEKASPGHSPFRLRFIADRLRIIRNVSITTDSVFLANGATFPYIRQMESIVLKEPVTPITFTAIIQTKLQRLDPKLCEILKEGVLSDLKGIPIE